MALAICPSCGEDIKITGRTRTGQKLSCPHCDAWLEVIEVDPVELDWVYDEFDEEDEEDEEWDLDEEWDEEDPDEEEEEEEYEDE